MPIQHRILPDSELHEPKGAANAIGGTIYVSDGAGSGSWKKVPAASLQGIPSGSSANRYLATDGSGGVKLVDGQIYGQIMYRVAGSSPVNYTAVSYTPVVLNNVAQNGTHLRALVTGTYLVRFTASSFADNTGTLTGITTDMRLTIDGSNAIGSSCRGTPTIAIEAIVHMIAGTEVYVIMAGGINFFTRDGSLSMTYLGA